MNNSIAILGATSHIAKGLIFNFIKSGRSNKLFLFSRSPERIKKFLKENGLKGDIRIERFQNFPLHNYDTIINCVGIGTPNKIKNIMASVFQLTEEFDNLVISYLEKHPRSRYINFSSGAVYGGIFSEQIREDTVCKVAVNDLKMQDCYGIAKINSEAKHRSRKDLNIVDIRIFSYFSRFIDFDSGYFLSDALKSIKENRELRVDACDFTRDYLGPDDLFSLVKLIIKNKPFNGALDAYSRKPVRKFKLLDFFTKKYGLRYVFDKKAKFNCPTGKKNVYSSLCRQAARLGYKPKFTSLESVRLESGFIFFPE